jgi:hypothetical protein
LMRYTSLAGPSAFEDRPHLAGNVRPAAYHDPANEADADPATADTN